MKKKHLTKIIDALKIDYPGNFDNYEHYIDMPEGITPYLMYLTESNFIRFIFISLTMYSRNALKESPINYSYFEHELFKEFDETNK